MISTFLWIPAHDCPHKRNRNVEEVVAHDTHLKDQDALDDEERQLLKGTSASALMWSEKEQRKNGAEKISRGPRPPQMLAAFPSTSVPAPQDGKLFYAIASARTISRLVYLLSKL